MAHYAKRDAKAWARENLRGQFTTLMTLFTPSDELDEEGIRRNIRAIRALGTRGAGCSWNMGEFWSLTREERLRLYDVVSEEAAGKWTIAAQVTHTSYKEAISLARHAESRGFDLLILAAPYIATKAEKQVVDFVRVVAEGTNLGIMFYNSPQFGIVMSPAGLKELCRIPNVVGVKEASFNQQISIDTHLQVGKDAVISTPDDWIYFKGKELGFQQQVMFANTSDWRFGKRYVEWSERANAGDVDRAFYDAHVKPFKDLSDKWWPRMVQKHAGVLPVALCKFWGELMGLCGGPVRLPLQDLTPEEKAELRKDLAAVREGVRA
ncbi:MAG: dihydrodipicolinate synthase family protein [Planctomycetes bacterium]|nr:dihydrodipicolinate synthase family protein [Planctomycetota bacterium]